jgi:uncharacterized protein (DUF4415 family)
LVDGDRPQFDHQRLPSGIGRIRFALGTDGILGPVTLRDPRSNVHRDDAICFVARWSISARHAHVSSR